MRLEYWKTAWHVAKVTFGSVLGTGDIASAIEKQYQLDQSSLAPEYQKESSQPIPLPFWATFGVLGLIFFLVYLFYPYFIVSKEHQRVFFIFINCRIVFPYRRYARNPSGVTFFYDFSNDNSTGFAFQ